MPTLKKRINLTLDNEMHRALSELAKEEQTSVASVSYSLLEKALELREDRYFSKIGDERVKSKAKKVSSKNFWK